MQNNINSINTSNLTEKNLLKLEQNIINQKLNNNKNSNLNDKIRQKIIDFSYNIYLEAFTCKKEKETELINLQKKLLQIFNLYFKDPAIINRYLDGISVILFLRYSKKPIIKNDILYWENSSGNLIKNDNFKQKYKDNIKKFKELLNNAEFNILKIDILKKEVNMLNTFCKILFEHNIISNDINSNDKVKIIKFYEKFLEKIYKLAINKKDKDFLNYLEIYNNLFAEYARYFGYPNNENNSNNKFLKYLEELFKILKNLNLENENQKRQNINKGVKLTMNSLLGKVKNRVNEKLIEKKETNNYSSINKNINSQNNLSELKKIAENILKLYENSFNKKERNKLHSSFKKIIKKIQNDILPRFYRNQNNIEKMEKEINTKQTKEYIF